MKIFDSNTSSTWNYIENHLDNESLLNIVVFKKGEFLWKKEMAARDKRYFCFNYRIVVNLFKQV